LERSLSGYIPRSLEVAATLLSPEGEIPAAVTELTEAGVLGGVEHIEYMVYDRYSTV
jgi:hypothetical protein